MSEVYAFINDFFQILFMKRSRLRKNKKLTVMVGGRKFTEVSNSAEYQKILGAIDRKKIKVRLA